MKPHRHGGTATSTELRIAVGLLTRIPTARTVPCGPADVGRSAAWFPLVGLLVGAVHVGVWLACREFFPPLVTAMLILAVDILFTGGMHLDGLADTADGFGGWTRAQSLAIMRDHAVGTYGALALVLALGLKAASIGALLGSGPAPILLTAPVLGRWAGVTLGFVLPYSRNDEPSTGTALSFIGRREWAIATTITLVTGATLLGRAVPATFVTVSVAVVLVTAGWGWHSYRRIGGTTGDTAGAGIVIAESTALLMALV